MKSWAFTLLLSCIIMLTACGFHLKGRQILPPELHTIHVEDSHFNPLTKQLESTLSAAGVTIVATKDQAPVTLKILNQSRNEQATTVGASQQTREYTLSYTVSFALINQAGKILAGPLIAKQQRYQVLQSSQILGATSQTEDLYDDMLKEIVNQIMDQLGSINIQDTLKKGHASP